MIFDSGGSVRSQRTENLDLTWEPPHLNPGFPTELPKMGRLPGSYFIQPSV